MREIEEENPMPITQRLILTICTLSILNAPHTLTAQRLAVDHNIFAELLGKYVKQNRVDYSGFKAEEKKLDAYLKVLETTNTAELDRPEQFAFYINAYNAWTIKLILSGYPGISSVWDLGGRFFDKPFKKEFIRLDRQKISLDHIENNILRPRFEDPRVHFAINCASKSCPPLRAEPYRGAVLDRQLDEMTGAFVNDPESTHLQENRLYVSKIFKWFSGDFGDDAAGFVVKYATGDLKRALIEKKNELRVKYLDYDWSLNDV